MSHMNVFGEPRTDEQRLDALGKLMVAVMQAEAEYLAEPSESNFGRFVTGLDWLKIKLAELEPMESYMKGGAS